MCPIAGERWTNWDCDSESIWRTVSAARLTGANDAFGIQNVGYT
jgi:hypothetical protein